MLKTDRHIALLKFNNAIIIAFLALMICFDFLDKIEIFYNVNLFKFSRYLKLLMFIHSLGFICFHLSYIIGKLKYLIFTILILSIIFLLKQSYWELYRDEFLRYIFILIVFPVLHYTWFYSSDLKLNDAFYKLFQVFIIVNFCAISIGIAFNIEVLKTYQFGRFGYNGILLSQGVTPYVYLAATVLFWSRKNYWLVGLVILAAAISGIKGIYLGLFMLMALLIWFDKRFNKALKTKFIIGCVVIFAVLLGFIFSTETFREVIENDGIMSAIFSYRLDNLYELAENSSATDFNIVIGAIGLETVRLELQLIDVFLFFGTLGVLVYVYFFTHVFKEIVKSFESKAFFSVCLLLSLLSGNLLYIPLAMVLFVLTLLVLNPKVRKHKNS